MTVIKESMNGRDKRNSRSEGNKDILKKFNQQTNEYVTAISG